MTREDSQRARSELRRPVAPHETRGSRASSLTRRPRAARPARGADARQSRKHIIRRLSVVLWNREGAKPAYPRARKISAGHDEGSPGRGPSVAHGVLYVMQLASDFWRQSGLLQQALYREQTIGG